MILFPEENKDSAHDRFPDQMQAIQDRGKFGAEHSAKGDYDTTRCEPNPASKVA